MISWFEKRGDYFHLNYTSLALFRIGLGLSVTLEQVYNLWYLKATYASSGVVPIQIVGKLFDTFNLGAPIVPSLHLLFPQALPFLIALQLILALLFTIGVGVRYLVWPMLYLTLSFNIAIFPFAQQTNLLTFWLLLAASLLPVNRALSLDPDTRSTNAFGAAIFLLFVMVFTYSLAHAWGQMGWQSGTALKILLQRTDVATSLGSALGALLPPTPAITLPFRVIQLFVPFLLLIPLPTVRVVTIATNLFVFLSYALFLNLGTQPLLCIALWLAILPTSFLEKLKWFGTADTRMDSGVMAPTHWLRPAALVVAAAVLAHVVITYRPQNPNEGIIYGQSIDVRRFGISDQFRRMYITNRSRGWLKIYAGAAPGERKESYDFITNQFSTFAGLEQPPANIFSETLHNQRFRAIYSVITRGYGGKNIFWPAWKSHLCRRIRAQRPYTNIEVVWNVQPISLDGTQQPVREISVFAADCAEVLSQNYPFRAAIHELAPNVDFAVEVSIRTGRNNCSFRRAIRG